MPQRHRVRPPRRIRSHRGPGGRTRDQLSQGAREKNVKGRSKMSKRQLERVVGR